MNNILLLALTLLFSSAVLAQDAEPPTNTHSLIWADLVSSQPQASALFYEKLLGWELQNSAFNDYQVFVFNNEKVAGLVSHPAATQKQPSEAQWISQVSVPSVPTAVDQATKLQARILIPAKTVAEHELAVISDPQGGIIAMVSGKRRMNDAIWQWAQLFSPSISASSDFYENWLGFKIEPLKDSVNQYHIYENGTPLASISKLPEAMQQRARWVSFIAVDNISAILEKLPTLGGKIIFAPDAQTYQSKLAIIADPQGAVLGLIEQEGE